MFLRKGIWIGVFVVATFLSGCNDKGRSTDKKVFRLNLDAGLTSLDPAFSRSQNNLWMVHQIFDGLVEMDSNLKVQSAIAKRWEVLEDGRLFRFILRDNVCFHDHPQFENGKGRKVVAQDVVYSLKRLVDPKTASPGSWIFNDKIVEENPFSAPNDSTFELRIKESFPPMLGLLSMQYCSVVPKEIVEFYGKDFRENPIGTGPFKFNLWVENERLILHKNSNYFQSTNAQPIPKLDAVMVSFNADRQTAFLSFLGGNLDLITSLDVSFKDDLLTRAGQLRSKYKDKVNLQSLPYLNTEYLGILVDQELGIVQGSPLAQKKIRQALNFGFDREKMMKYLRNDIGTPGNKGMIPNGLPGHADSSYYPYNPDKANALLAEAGFPNGVGLAPIKVFTGPEYKDLLEFIQSEWRKLGVELVIEINPGSAIRQMVAKSEANMFRASWIADYPDAENYLGLFYSPNFAPNGPNYTHYKNEDFDRLFQQTLKEKEEEKRHELYKKMDALIMEEAPVIVLYYDQVVRLVSPKVSGLSPNALNLLELKTVDFVN